MDSARKELTGEIVSISDHIAAMIRPVSEGDISLKNSTWTISTAAAHLVISQKLSKRILSGDENPYKNAKPETVAASFEEAIAA